MEEDLPAGGASRERATTPAVRRRSRLLAAIQFLSAIVLAAGLAAVHLLPSLELLTDLSRSEEMAASLYRLGSLPPRHFFTLLDPELLGRPLPDWSYFGASYFWTLAFYVPALLLPLAALSLTRPEGRRYRNFFLALIPFLLLFAMGPHTPVYALFHRFVPGVRLFREPARILFFYPLSMAVLAGLGWNALRKQGGAGSEAGARPRGGDAEGGKVAETGATEPSRAVGRPAEGGPAGGTDNEADERESAAGAGGSGCSSNAGRHASQPAAAASGWPKRATVTLSILLGLLLFLAAGAASFVSNSAGLREAAFQRSAAFFIGREEVALRAARQYEENWQRGLPLSAGAAFVLFGGSFALCLAAVRRGVALPARTLRGAALLLVAADLLFFGRGYLATRPAPRLFDPGGPLASHLADLARREPPFRVADLSGALPDSLAEVAGLEKVGGYDPINLAATQRYFNALNGRGDEGGPAWTLAVEPGFDRLLLDLLGARYIVSREPMSLEGLSLERTLENVPATLMNYGPILFPRIHVYRNEQAFPRAWFVERAQRLDLEAPLGLQLAAVDLERVVLLEEGGDRAGRGAGGDSRQAPSGLIQVQPAGPDSLRIEAECPSAGFIVLSQAWASGWRAWEEGSGREVRPLRADGMLTALPVAAGRSLLELTYRPRTYRAGLVLSLTSLVLLLTIVVLDRRVSPGSGRPAHRPGAIPP